MRRIWMVGVGCLVFAACGGDDGSSNQTEQRADQTTSTSTATSTTAAGGGEGRLHVTRADFGDEWPLTVEDGDLECMRDVVAGFEKLYVTFTTGGVIYAVNGSASAIADDISPIWAPSDDGFSKPIAPLINRGLSLCP